MDKEDESKIMVLFSLCLATTLLNSSVVVKNVM